MSFHSFSNRPRVYKLRGFLYPPGHLPWVAIHPAGNMRFATWREAYDWASTPIIMMN